MIPSEIIGCAEKEVLENFALELLNAEDYEQVQKLLDEDLEAGEHLEKIYLALEALEVIVAAKPTGALKAFVIASVLAAG